MTHHKYNLRMIPMTKLSVDHEYQRDFSEQYAKSLACIWDWDECLPLVGSLRKDGLTYVIDGQHRYGAMIINEYSGTVPVLQYTGLDKPQEARLFLAYNSTRTVAMVDKHKARVESFDKTAISIENVLFSRNLRIGKGQYPRCIGAASSCYKVVNKFGIHSFAEALDAIDTVFDGDLPGVFQAPLIEGIGGFYALASKSVLDNDRLLKKIIGSKTIEGWVLTAREEAGSRGSLGDGMRRALIRSYNRGLPDSRKI